MLEQIKVKYQHTTNTYKAKTILDNLPNLFSVDFEIASRYDKDGLPKDIEDIKEEKDIILKQIVNSNGLSHPCISTVTHMSVAWSKEDAFVIVCDNESIKKLIFNFLTSTDKVQIWHNASFDFTHIYYATNKIPKNFIDTYLLSKTLLNNANPVKDKTSLKELMGYAYGDWAISKEFFNLKEIYSEKVIEYSAVDAAATYKLYRDIQNELSVRFIANKKTS